jgi:hypothetical protein
MAALPVAKVTLRPLPNLLALFTCSRPSDPITCLYMALLAVYLNNFSDYPDIAACLFISCSECGPARRIHSPTLCDQQSRLRAHGVYTRRLLSTTRVLLTFPRHSSRIALLVASALYLLSTPTCVGIPVAVSALLPPYKTASGPYLMLAGGSMLGTYSSAT